MEKYTTRLSKILLAGCLIAVGCNQSGQAPSADPVVAETEVATESSRQDKAARDVQAIADGYAAEMDAFNEWRRGAPAEEVQAEFRTRLPSTDAAIKRMMTIAKQHPDTEAEFESLLWVAVHGANPTALDALLDKYLDRDRLATMLPRLGYRIGFKTEECLRKARTSPSQPVRSSATLTLANYLKHVHDVVAAVKLEPDSYGQYGAPREYVSQFQPDFEEVEGLFEEALKNEEYDSNRKRMEASLYEVRYLRVGKKVPELEGVDLHGAPLKLSDYRGKVVLVSFWATWCGPCMGMIPHERALIKHLEDAPFALIGVNGDSDREVVKPILKSMQITWPSFSNGPEGASGPIARKWNVTGWPTLYLIDTEGTIRFKNTLGKTLDRAIQQLLKEAGHEVDLSRLSHD